jgi:hypothetical protein
MAINLLSAAHCKNANSNGASVRKLSDGDGLCLWVYLDGLKYWRERQNSGSDFPPLRSGVVRRSVSGAGDILVSVRAPVGPTNVAAVRCRFGRGLAAIRADGSKLEADYLRFFFVILNRVLEAWGKGQPSRRLAEQILYPCESHSHL